MRRSLLNDALELFRLNVSISILVEVVESLSDALALEASEHLRKLWIGHGVCLLAAANVELGPFRVPVEWKAVFIHVLLDQLAKVVPSDEALVIGVEEAECHVIFGIWPGEEVLVCCELIDRKVDIEWFMPVRDAEENAELFSLNLMLCRQLVSKAVITIKPKQQCAT